MTVFLAWKMTVFLVSEVCSKTILILDKFLWWSKPRTIFSFRGPWVKLQKYTDKSETFQFTVHKHLLLFLAYLSLFRCSLFNNCISWFIGCYPSFIDIFSKTSWSPLTQLSTFENPLNDFLGFWYILTFPPIIHTDLHFLFENFWCLNFYIDPSSVSHTWYWRVHFRIS